MLEAKTTLNEFYLSCERKDTHIISEILSNYKKINYLKKDFKTFHNGILLLCTMGQYDMVELICLHPKVQSFLDISYLNKSFLTHSVITGNVQLVDFFLHSALLKNTISIDEEKHNDFFFESCRYKHLNLVNYWATSPNLTYNVNVYERENLALYLACKNNDINMIYYLLDSEQLKERCQVNSCYFRAINAILWHNNIELLDYLIKHPTSNLPEEKYYYSLNLAIDRNLTIVTSYLIDNFTHYYPDKKFNIHYDDDIFLTTAYFNEDNENSLVKYFIFEKHIKRTDTIIKFIKANDAFDLDTLFNTRDFNNHLNQNLHHKSSKTTIKKI